MQEISREYLLLFNTLTDVEDTLLRLRAQLMEAQRRAEELYLDDGEFPVSRVS